MNFYDYLNKKEYTNEQASFINFDKNIEIEYMKDNLNRFNLIFTAIQSSTEPICILDVGTTPFTFYLKHEFPHYQIYSIDRTDLLKTRCENKGINFLTLNLDEANITFPDNKFDVVIFTEVLEHIFAPPSRILKELWRIIKPEGKLILSVPNIARLSNRIKLLLGISPLEHPEKQLSMDHVHGHGHIHEYTMKEILTLLENYNFIVTKKFYCSKQLFYIMCKSEINILKKLVNIIYYSLCQLIPPFRYTIYTESLKKVLK